MANFKIRDKTEFIAIHCSATGENQNIGRAEIDRWHRAQGWNGIGYHFVIRRDGTVETGRPVEAIGSHVAGYNATSVGICMVGGVDANDPKQVKDNFTKEQMMSLLVVVKDLKARYPEAVVQGHRDFPDVKKACPSFDAKAWWRKVQ